MNGLQRLWSDWKQRRAAKRVLKQPDHYQLGDEQTAADRGVSSKDVGRVHRARGSDTV